jgi:hypothetical protein
MDARPHSMMTQWIRKHFRLCAYAISSTPTLAAVLLLLSLPASLSADTDIFAPPVSYTYTDGGGLSTVVSYQYHEWPGGGILPLQYSPLVSYFFQAENQDGAVVLFGQVSDDGGNAIHSATVTVSVALSKIAQQVTDASGSYQFPPMDGGVYVLAVSHPTHATSVSAL